MRLTTIALVATTALIAFSAYQNLTNTGMKVEITPEVATAYSQWKVKHSKLYSSPSEESFRLNVFAQNYHYIKEGNAQGRTYTMGLNKFSDWTDKEFETKYLGGAPDKKDMVVSANPEDYAKPNLKANPDNWDWRFKGEISAVRDHKTCRASYAFSSADVVESAYAIFKKQKAIPFSPQQIIDCEGSTGACDGNVVAQKALLYILTKGITTEENYPYRAYQGFCRTSFIKNQVHPKRFYHVGANDQSMEDSVFKGPTTTYLDHHKDMRFYKSGVFYRADCKGSPFHFATLVGYHKWSADNSYWVLKMPWGADYGDKGFLRLKKVNGSTDSGPCGVHDHGRRPEFE